MKNLKSVQLFILIFSTIFFVNACSKDKKENEEPVIKNPPFSGTIFIAPEIIQPGDVSVFQAILYQGIGSRLVFSRKSDQWETKDMYLFESTFSNGRTTSEIQVEASAFSLDSATTLAYKYSKIIGQLPVINRSDLQTVTIREGLYAFGGGSHNLLIYTDYDKENYEKQGIIEETLVHETTHISLDLLYSHTDEWYAMQKADGNFISTYAEDNPDREDMAESFLLYLAVRYRPSRISKSLADTIKNTMSNRIKFFDKQSFDMRPFK